MTADEDVVDHVPENPLLPECSRSDVCTHGPAARAHTCT